MHHFRPLASEAGNCVCASAWLPEGERGGDDVYLHRPDFDPKVYRDFPENTATAYGDLARSARAYLTDMDVPTSVIDRMFATKSTDATRLTVEELELLEMAPYFRRVCHSE